MKLLPIIGPQPKPVALRPKCMYCHAPLRPRIYHEWQNNVRLHRIFTGRYGLCDLFCGPHHAERWGLEVARRIVEGKAVLLGKEEHAKLKNPNKRSGAPALK